MNCKNCNKKVHLNYCDNCGHPVHVKRINGQYVLKEIQQVLNFEKGIFYTIWELLIRPGENVRHFITENRSRLVKPVIFIIATSLIYSLVNDFFLIEDGYVRYDGVEESTTVSILQWIQGHYGYANLIMAIFIAFSTKLFFRKYGYNFYEILILLCFVMGMGMLFLAIFGILEGLTNFGLMQIGGILFIIYFTWAIGQFFERKKPLNYFKAFASYMLGMITFMLCAILLGALIDLIIKL
ncbi:DUF3667 domain-containing protein [Salegentibacter sp. F188]|uniref:DUF3667 domain-containing protein n=1 Tax=Autumnicola patrickiae TaxID=3075591 RepID=A0ABU3E1M2_9FLAO|nr:DUF3667 domain-containing protein [Salegentibacter sp. F188]MDT0689157.1 DUF3667 domain-containing protein [Salegentibacter sp. F188]